MITLQMHWLAIVFGVLIAFTAGLVAYHNVVRFVLRAFFEQVPDPRCARCQRELELKQRNQDWPIPKGVAGLLCPACASTAGVDHAATACWLADRQFELGLVRERIGQASELIRQGKCPEAFDLMFTTMRWREVELTGLLECGGPAGSGVDDEPR